MAEEIMLTWMKKQILSLSESARSSSEERVMLLTWQITLLDHIRKSKPLSVELGPEILGNIFDGIQRPLKTIAKRSGDVYIPRGVSIPALDKDILWEFQPKKIGEGDHITGGDLYATVFENTLMQHHMTLPPDAMGKVTYVAPAGQYSLKISALKGKNIDDLLETVMLVAEFQELKANHERSANKEVVWFYPATAWVRYNMIS